MGAGEQLAKRFYAALDEHDLDAARELYQPDAEFAAPGPVQGDPDVAVAWMGPFLDAFPDIRHRVVSLFESGDDMALELEIDGTHTEPMRSPQGEIPATGRDLHLTAANIIRLRDGKIASQRIYFDQASFMGQLGLLPG